MEILFYTSRSSERAQKVLSISCLQIEANYLSPSAPNIIEDVVDNWVMHTQLGLKPSVQEWY